MRRIVVVAAALLLAACRAERGNGQQADTTSVRPRRDVLADVPSLNPSNLRDTTGTPEAQYREYATLVTLDSVRNFYRHILPALGWSVRNDQGDSAEATIYAVRDSGVVWVRIWRLEPTTRYALIGGTQTADRAGPMMYQPPSRP